MSDVTFVFVNAMLMQKLKHIGIKKKIVFGFIGVSLPKLVTKRTPKRSCSSRCFL